MSDRQSGNGGPRLVRLAMWRGARGLCPNCGRGRLFASYLKVKPQCDVCGTALYHYNAAYNAELAPAFLVQSIVAVPVGFACAYLASGSDWSWARIAAVWGPLAIILSVAPLQPIKGAIVGLQWASRLDEFGPGSGSAPWLRDPAAPPQ